MKPIYAAGLAAIVCLTSCSRKSESAPEEAPEIQVAEAVTDSVVIHKTYPGSLTANRNVDVVGRVNGQLMSRNYEGGDLVTKGQVLFTIDPGPYRDRVHEAEAALATARSSYDYNSRHYEALKKAFESDAVSQMDLIQAESAYRQSQADIKNCEAQLSSARTMLGYCTVTAPITGHISSSVLNVGSYIGGEAQPVTLATIYQDDVLKANFAIEDEQYIQLLRDSTEESAELRKIPLTFSEKLPHDYTADLYYMSPAIDASTGTMVLRAKLENPYNELRSGMFVSISLPVGNLPEAVLIRDASIGTDQLGKYVYVVNDSNKVVYTPITTGEVVRDSMRVVSKGLKKGDRYVTRALLKVRDGMTVRPVLTK